MSIFLRKKCSSRMCLQLLIVLLVAVLSCSPTFAGDEDLVDIDCSVPDGSSFQANYCAGVQAGEADEKLNKVYQKLVKKIKAMGAEDKTTAGKEHYQKMLEQLRTAEREWIKYADSRCDYEAAEYEGGTLQSAIGSSCYTRLATEQIKRLQQQLEGL